MPANLNEILTALPLVVIAAMVLMVYKSVAQKS